MGRLIEAGPPKIDPSVKKKEADDGLREESGRHSRLDDIRTADAEGLGPNAPDLSFLADVSQFDKQPHGGGVMDALDGGANLDISPYARTSALLNSREATSEHIQKETALADEARPLALTALRIENGMSVTPEERAELKAFLEQNQHSIAYETARNALQNEARGAANALTKALETDPPAKTEFFKQLNGLSKAEIALIEIEFHKLALASGTASESPEKTIRTAIGRTFKDASDTPDPQMLALLEGYENRQSMIIANLHERISELSHIDAIQYAAMAGGGLIGAGTAFLRTPSGGVVSPREAAAKSAESSKSKSTHEAKTTTKTSPEGKVSTIFEETKSNTVDRTPTSFSVEGGFSKLYRTGLGTGVGVAMAGAAVEEFRLKYSDVANLMRGLSPEQLEEIKHGLDTYSLSARVSEPAAPASLRTLAGVEGDPDQTLVSKRSEEVQQIAESTLDAMQALQTRKLALSQHEQQLAEIMSALESGVAKNGSAISDTSRNEMTRQVEDLRTNIQQSREEISQNSQSIAESLGTTLSSLSRGEAEQAFTPAMEQWLTANGYESGALDFIAETLELGDEERKQVGQALQLGFNPDIHAWALLQRSLGSGGLYSASTDTDRAALLKVQRDMFEGTDESQALSMAQRRELIDAYEKLLSEKTSLDEASSLAEVRSPEAYRDLSHILLFGDTPTWRDPNQVSGYEIFRSPFPEIADRYGISGPGSKAIIDVFTSAPTLGDLVYRGANGDGFDLKTPEGLAAFQAQVIEAAQGATTEQLKLFGATAQLRLLDSELLLNTFPSENLQSQLFGALTLEIQPWERAEALRSSLATGAPLALANAESQLSLSSPGADPYDQAYANALVRDVYASMYGSDLENALRHNSPEIYYLSDAAEIAQFFSSVGPKNIDEFYALLDEMSDPAGAELSYQKYFQGHTSHEGYTFGSPKEELEKHNLLP